MKRSNVHAMTAAQLVERFISIALDESQAELVDDSAKLRRLFWQMESVEDELKVRPGDQRQILTRLYDHPNAQVRLKAAKATLAVAPEAARRVLQFIKDRREYPQALDAGMT